MQRRFANPVPFACYLMVSGRARALSSLASRSGPLHSILENRIARKVGDGIPLEGNPDMLASSAFFDSVRLDLKRAVSDIQKSRDALADLGRTLSTDRMFNADEVTEIHLTAWTYRSLQAMSWLAEGAINGLESIINTYDQVEAVARSADDGETDVA